MSLAPPNADAAKDPPVLLSKTCQNCFSLKIRCDRTQRQDICDRCARLGKNCVFRPARRRDNSAKRDSRIQALEAQVQDLLRTQNPGPVVQQPLPQVSTISVTGAVLPGSSAANIPPQRDVVDEEIVTIEKADILVELYKSDMMPHFPFILVPSYVTGTSLRHEKPFLFLAILSVAAYHDLATQDKLADRFKYLVSDRVLLGGDECLSLEYLQGLLVVLAWNQYHSRSKYYSQYLQLAISIAVDMRLDRKHHRSKPTNVGSKRDPIANLPATKNWGHEEQRAAAGLFYLSSTISKLLDKMNTFPCTQSIEEGCISLRETGEYRTDRDLFHVIRLQKIIENIDVIANQSSLEGDAQTSYLRIRSELEEFRAFLVSDVADSHLLFMQFHTAKLFLYQVAFFERNLQHSPQLHLNILCEGLEGAKSFLDLYLWLPPKSEMNLTNSEWIQLSFGVILAAKFAIVSKNPNVELATRELRQRLNIDNVFRHLSLRIGALVGRAGEENKKKDIFYYYEQRTRKVQTWFERLVRATGSDSPPSQQASIQNVIHPPQQTLSPSAGTSPLPQVSVHTAYQTPQQPQYPQQTQQYYPSTPMATPPNQMGHTPVASVGMTPMTSTYPAYSSTPTIAFDNLMNAPGWDMPFTIPMENDAWLWDVTQGYGGPNMASPPSDGTWPSPGTAQ